ncbi:MAG: response regulator [Candidatus Lloydbacteria bacterium CG22_combo_CG10-13_8_21_14_all_47_15]|uniref:Response regulator n=1 Tax=Candidatus Lloydbacteria bacterium CG22_combo_CG10-13_8_21_14_all_47_15 TaxID=1974635 RepID=A0A2H0CW51_9BACT|nr:MAG: response regulator [Candidatus Lloydbacteria bacterium CG22_combo_CG10-13_8_21_14_all_47_15]
MAKDKKKIVFIVDDDKFLLDMYALKFGEAGFQVETAANAQDALDRFKDGLIPDVLLLDIVMPGMDGFEFLSAVTEEKLLPNTEKIILSNIGQEEDIERGRKLGADGYIVKASATPTEVVKKVEEIMQK